MAIAKVEEHLINDNSGTNMTTSGITIGAGSNRLVVLIAAANGISSAITKSAAVLGSQAFTDVLTHNTVIGNPNPCYYIGYIKEVDIPAGSNIPSVDWSGGAVKSGMIVVFSGVDQTNPIIESDGQSSTTDPDPIILGSLQSGDAVFVAGGQGTSAPTLPSGYTATTTASFGDTTVTTATGIKLISSSGAESPDYTFSGNRLAQVGVSLLADGNAPAPSSSIPVLANHYRNMQ